MTARKKSTSKKGYAVQVVGLRLNSDLKDRIDAYRDSMEVKPSLSSTLRSLIESALDERGA